MLLLRHPAWHEGPRSRHFVPWSRSGDDGLDNLVVACRRCNGAKSATLAGPRHLEALLARNADLAPDLRGLALERRWTRDTGRTSATVRASYLVGASNRRLWEWEASSTRGRLLPFAAAAEDIERLLAQV